MDGRTVWDDCALWLMVEDYPHCDKLTHTGERFTRLFTHSLGDKEGFVLVSGMNTPQVDNRSDHKANGRGGPDPPSDKGQA